MYLRLYIGIYNYIPTGRLLVNKYYTLYIVYRVIERFLCIGICNIYIYYNVFVYIFSKLIYYYNIRINAYIM